jgi:hypothetical protein
MLNNRVLRKTFWPKRDKVTGEWRRLHNEELYDLYSTPNFICVIISRRMREAGHVTLWMKRKEHKWFGGEF